MHRWAQVDSIIGVTMQGALSACLYCTAQLQLCGAGSGGWGMTQHKEETPPSRTDYCMGIPGPGPGAHFFNLTYIVFSLCLLCTFLSGDKPPNTQHILSNIFVKPSLMEHCLVRQQVCSAQADSFLTFLRD